MELPALKLPAINLPFDVPVLLHPPIDHFVIAIPVIVLLVEIINLFAKKRAIGVITFFLLVVGMLAAFAAYYTGTIDGKEAFDGLTQAGQTELKAHKLLGTYLMLASVVVVLFKLLSATIKKGLMKGLYLLVLVVFVAGIFKQGHDGGELVYEYGANVERVADLDSDLFDAKEELDDLKEEMKSNSQKAAETVEAVKKTVSEVVESAAKKTNEAVESAKESGTAAVEAVKAKGAEAVEAVKAKAAEVTGNTPAPAVEKVEEVPAQTVPVETH